MNKGSALTLPEVGKASHGSLEGSQGTELGKG
jgi:hypothetical protein